ncbi:hypothetical protein FBY35_3394 [Streptomyces sp. SLBN-118]|nr:hypothetical protein FBY35_3394 [Streptomyces sp. SLBN-118]
MAGLIGAAVAAISGLGGGALTLLGQSKHLRQQHDRDGERWRDGTRLDAYSSLLASSKQLSNALWKAADQLRDAGSSADDCQTRHEEAHDAWTQFSAAAAKVSIAGTPAVAEAVDVLRGAMYNWQMVCTAWTKAVLANDQTDSESFNRDFEAAAEAKHPADRAFERAARKTLGMDD